VDGKASFALPCPRFASSSVACCNRWPCRNDRVADRPACRSGGAKGKCNRRSPASPSRKSQPKRGSSCVSGHAVLRYCAEEDCGVSRFSSRLPPMPMQYLQTNRRRRFGFSPWRLPIFARVARFVAFRSGALARSGHRAANPLRSACGAPAAIYRENRPRDRAGSRSLSTGFMKYSFCGSSSPYGPGGGSTHVR
jgi:hypothetical protein